MTFMVDATRPYTKLDLSILRFDKRFPFKNESKTWTFSHITPLLTQKMIDESIENSLASAENHMRKGLRFPFVRERAYYLYQAVVIGNNQLFELGYRRTVFSPGNGLPDEYFVENQHPNADQFLKKVKKNKFLMFLISAARKPIGGGDGEFDDDIRRWQCYLLKIDIQECFRQACIFGQSAKRRQFFLMASFNKMNQLIYATPDITSLYKMKFPVPALLDLLHDAPHFFEVDENELSEEYNNL